MSVNKKLEKVSVLLNENIKETIEYKEYKTNKDLLENNERLKNLRTNLEKLKHLMCTCSDESIRGEYTKAREEYDSSPVVVNFKISEERLNVLVKGLIEQISLGL